MGNQYSRLDTLQKRVNQQSIIEQVVCWRGQVRGKSLPSQQKGGKSNIDEHFHSIVRSAVLYFEVTDQFGSFQQHITAVV